MQHCPGLGILTDLYNHSEPATHLNNSWTCSQASQPPTCVYEDELFASRMEANILAHNASAGPFFGFLALHNCHVPLQVPQA